MRCRGRMGTAGVRLHCASGAPPLQAARNRAAAAERAKVRRQARSTSCSPNMPSAAHAATARACRRRQMRPCAEARGSVRSSCSPPRWSLTDRTGRSLCAAPPVRTLSGTAPRADPTAPCSPPCAAGTLPSECVPCGTVRTVARRSVPAAWAVRRVARRRRRVHSPRRCVQRGTAPASVWLGTWVLSALRIVHAAWQLEQN